MLLMYPSDARIQLMKQIKSISDWNKLTDIFISLTYTRLSSLGDTGCYT